MQRQPWTTGRSRFGIGGGQERIYTDDIGKCHRRDACNAVDLHRLVPFRERMDLKCCQGDRGSTVWLYVSSACSIYVCSNIYNDWYQLLPVRPISSELPREMGSRATSGRAGKARPTHTQHTQLLSLSMITSQVRRRVLEVNKLALEGERRWSMVLWTVR